MLQTMKQIFFSEPRNAECLPIKQYVGGYTIREGKLYAAPVFKYINNSHRSVPKKEVARIHLLSKL